MPDRTAPDQITSDHRPEVLFVCVHNAGRSQMAAAYTHHLSGGAVEVRSAGSAPADQAALAAATTRRRFGPHGRWSTPVRPCIARGAVSRDSHPRTAARRRSTRRPR